MVFLTLLLVVAVIGVLLRPSRKLHPALLAVVAVGGSVLAPVALPPKAAPSSLPAPAIMQRSDAEWHGLFRKGSSREKATVLDQLRLQGNPVLAEEAAELLGTGEEDLIVAAVRYLRALSGKQMGNEPERWKALLNTPSFRFIAGMNSTSVSNNPLSGRGFSSVAVVNAIFASKDLGVDFFPFYLRNYFPGSVSVEDFAAIQEQIRLQPAADTDPQRFRRGMLLFFVATGETVNLAAGFSNTDAQVISGQWDECLQVFLSAGDSGRLVGGEIRNLLAGADANSDGALSRDELIQMTR